MLILFIGNLISVDYGMKETTVAIALFILIL